MIRSKKGDVKIKGTNTEVLCDFICVAAAMKEHLGITEEELRRALEMALWTEKELEENVGLMVEKIETDLKQAFDEMLAGMFRKKETEDEQEKMETGE